MLYDSCETATMASSALSHYEGKIGAWDLTRTVLVGVPTR